MQSFSHHHQGDILPESKPSFPVSSAYLPWFYPPPPDSNREQRGEAYLHNLQRHSLSPKLIQTFSDPHRHGQVCQWIGRNVHMLNQTFLGLLQRCQACLQDAALPAVDILTAPLAPAGGIAGFCNLTLQPYLLIVDPARQHPADWLAIVVHEYAHALAGTPGHGREFQAEVSRLCRGLGLRVPPIQGQVPDFWQTWPPYGHPSPDPEGFWWGSPGITSGKEAHFSP